jgi:hypothetical protein
MGEKSQPALPTLSDSAESVDFRMRSSPGNLVHPLPPGSEKTRIEGELLL